MECVFLIISLTREDLQMKISRVSNYVKQTLLQRNYSSDVQVLIKNTENYRIVYLLGYIVPGNIAETIFVEIPYWPDIPQANLEEYRTDQHTDWLQICPTIWL